MPQHVSSEKHFAAYIRVWRREYGLAVVKNGATHQKMVRLMESEDTANTVSRTSQTQVGADLESTVGAKTATVREAIEAHRMGPPLRMRRERRSRCRRGRRR